MNNKLNKSNICFVLSFNYMNTLFNDKIKLIYLPEYIENNSNFKKEFKKINKLNHYINYNSNVLILTPFFDKLNKLLKKCGVILYTIKIIINKNFLEILKKNKIKKIIIKNISNAILDIKKEDLETYFYNNKINIVMENINKLKININFYSFIHLNNLINIKNIDNFIVNIDNNNLISYIDDISDIFFMFDNNNYYYNNDKIFLLNIKYLNLIVEYLYNNYKNYKNLFLLLNKLQPDNFLKLLDKEEHSDLFFLLDKENLKIEKDLNNIYNKEKNQITKEIIKYYSKNIYKKYLNYHKIDNNISYYYLNNKNLIENFKKILISINDFPDFIKNIVYKQKKTKLFIEDI